ncbi:ATP-binding protein, partial [Streptomyces griseorubiginosus]|uniref:ATP-binding protein n=1 Tax=Streptomyces griseorubiginosus TaxID=67304 RepID=UPI003F764C26
MIGVIDTEGDCAEWTFPAEPDAVRTARTAVRGQLHTWRLDVLGDLTALLVSELVTNSLRHATGPIGVRLVRSPREERRCHPHQGRRRRRDPAEGDGTAEALPDQEGSAAAPG